MEFKPIILKAPPVIVKFGKAMLYGSNVSWILYTYNTIFELIIAPDYTFMQVI